jgi:DNA polymerase IV (DinB-like DNA polymerase)
LVRVIGHFDLDYFYAQVEEIEDPLLKGKPVVVCVFSGRTEDSGVVSTANYKAREFGIKSGMPIVLAKKKLERIDSAFIKMQHEKYEDVSEEIMELIRTKVDVLEQTGIDEAFLDITKSSGGDYSAACTMAAGIKAAVKESHGLTASIGVGQSKVVAKMASDSSKPDGLTVVTPESTNNFLSPLPIIRLYGVGPKTALALGTLGVTTVGDLANLDPMQLDRVFGRKTAVYLHEAANGTDEEPVIEKQASTQFSRIITLKKNTRDPDEAFNELMPAIDDLHQKLTSKGTSFRTLSAIGILSDLSVKSRSKTFGTPTDDHEVMKEGARALLRDLTTSIDKELRRVGIRLSDLSNTVDQTSLTQFE